MNYHRKDSKQFAKVTVKCGVYKTEYQLTVNRVLLKTNHFANAALLLLYTIHYLGNLVLALELQHTGVVGPQRDVSHQVIVPGS